MNEEDREKLRQLFFSDYKDEIILDEDIRSYFNRVDKDKLLGVLMCYTNTNKEIKEILELKEKDMALVVDYAIKVLNNLYDNIFKTIPIEYSYFFYDLINKDGYMRIKGEDLDYSIAFICFLKRFVIANVNYDNDKSMLEVYIPKDILNVIKNKINDKKFMKEIEQNNEIKTNISAILSAYGVVEFDFLLDIYNKKFKKINRDKLFDYVFLASFVCEDFNFFENEELCLVSTAILDDKEEVISFYKGIDTLEYKIFDKEEYYDIYYGGYINDIEEYDEILDILWSHSEVNEEIVTNFVDEVILDYIGSCQMEEDVSDFLNRTLQENYAFLTANDVKEIKKLLKKIVLKFPSWQYKGYSKEEKMRQEEK